ncbi:MAG TPA: MBL fold metallo-hydrolase [Mycobacteriales bacterium]|jgi:glyoxylase-like metal-dependent hydrolase (beta-lactamase superfamily II)|nr:MBL fold metallo-hydrolase [Mycobacteriales bacterium]
MAFGVTRVVTAGVFSLDGQDFDVENNVWVVGDDSGLLIVDAAHDAEAIAAVVDHRRVQAIVCTHGHNDHVNAAPELSDRVTAPIYLSAADRMLWDQVHPDRAPYDDLRAGDVFRIAGEDIHVLPTPGHSPGGICLYVPGQDLLFSGDTLFRGGPGATGRSFSDFPTILDSIRTSLLVLPPQTVVRTGHGADTTIGAEAPDYDAWVARGH